VYLEITPPHPGIPGMGDNPAHPMTKSDPAPTLRATAHRVEHGCAASDKGGDNGNWASNNGTRRGMTTMRGTGTTGMMRTRGTCMIGMRVRGMGTMGTTGTMRRRGMGMT